MTTIPFTIVVAFSTSVIGGNPAAVVFLDTETPMETLTNISKNFNQPMTVYLSPLPSDSSSIAAYATRYFAPNGMEIPLCGHATLAAGRAILEREGETASKIESLEFHTRLRGIIKVGKLANGWLELQVPESVPVALSDEERSKLEPMVKKALKKDVEIEYMGRGGENFDFYLLVEVKEDNLVDCIIDADALRDTGYRVDIITTASSNPELLYELRSFVPGVLPGDEDPVCGSANCILAPYWYQRRDIQPGAEITAAQVSSRGGKLRIVWDKDEGIVKLRGQSTVMASGILHL